jgi:predicted AlkP superfamily phosphohydrolase/phosphomutase
MEAARFERTVRTESSEIFAIYGGARRVGRIDLHYGRFEVHGTLLLEVDLTDDELQQIIDQIDEELVQTHDPEREDFLVTVFKSEELGFYSDEYEGDDDAGDEEDDR